MATIFKRGGKANRGGRYYVSWFDHTGKRRVKSARTSDYATAQRIAAKLEAGEALRREGVVDPLQETFSAEARKTVTHHLNAYEAHLRASGGSGKYVAELVSVIESIAKAAVWSRLSDIAADDVNSYAAALRKDGKSARTIGKHLTIVRGFTKWLTRTNKLARDPLLSVGTPSDKGDRRHERRMLLPEEWQQLQASILANVVTRCSVPAFERLLLYATAIQTGLRSSELRSLTPGRLHLNAPQPYATCAAGTTKNRKAARQFIKPELATALRTHAADRSGRPLFDMPDISTVPDLLRADLAAARKDWIDDASASGGRAWVETAAETAERERREKSDFLAAEDHDGRRLDFHALRHTCGSWLAMAGVHPKIVQTIMRHSTITLTMDRYGHLFPGSEAEAIGRLPAMLPTYSMDDSSCDAFPCVPDVTRRVETGESAATEKRATTKNAG